MIRCRNSYKESDSWEAIPLPTPLHWRAASHPAGDREGRWPSGTPCSALPAPNNAVWEGACVQPVTLPHIGCPGPLTPLCPDTPSSPSSPFLSPSCIYLYLHCFLLKANELSNCLSSCTNGLGIESVPLAGNVIKSREEEV